MTDDTEDTGKELEFIEEVRGKVVEQITVYEEQDGISRVGKKVLPT